MQSSLIEKTTKDSTIAANSLKRHMKIAIPLKCLRNFLRPLEMSLINWKIHLELTWIKNCVLASAGPSATLK